MTILQKLAESDQIVHVITAKRAAPLLRDKLVRRVTIQPAPRKGYVAVNITALGRGAANA